jgi:hypothetical protein
MTRSRTLEIVLGVEPRLGRPRGLPAISRTGLALRLRHAAVFNDAAELAVRLRDALATATAGRAATSA